MSDHDSSLLEGQEDDPRSVSTVYVGLIGVALTIVIVVALQMLFYRTRDAEMLRKAGVGQTQQLEQTRALQQQQLEGYRWVDREAGVVAIPIDRAIELIVEEGVESN